MEPLAKWMELEITMSLAGDSLKSLIDEQQQLARAEREEQRDLVALQLELEKTNS